MVRACAQTGETAVSKSQPIARDWEGDPIAKKIATTDLDTAQISREEQVSEHCGYLNESSSSTSLDEQTTTGSSCQQVHGSSNDHEQDSDQALNLELEEALQMETLRIQNLEALLLAMRSGTSERSYILLTRLRAGASIDELLELACAKIAG